MFSDLLKQTLFDKVLHPIVSISASDYSILRWNAATETSCLAKLLERGQPITEVFDPMHQSVFHSMLKKGSQKPQLWMLASKECMTFVDVFKSDHLQEDQEILVLFDIKSARNPINDDFQQAVQRSSIVSMADKQGIITYVNENFIKISGYTSEELIGQNHRIVNSSYHDRSFWLTMWKTISSGQTWRGEVKNKAKDGSYYWVDTFIMPFVDKQGKVREFLSIRNDITKRQQQAEEIVNLNASLADFQQAVQCSSIVSMADKQGIITYVNENFIKISGYTSEELIGQNHRIINSSHHDRSFWIDMWKTIASGQTWRGEVKNKAKDGSYYWVDTFIMPFLDKQGKVREFLSIRNDITQRKNREEQLTISNQRIANILKGITDGFFAVDHELKFQLVNQTFADIASKQAEEMIDKSLLELFPDLETDQLYAYYQDALRTKQSVSIEYQVPHLNEQFYQVNIYPNQDGLFVFYKDISATKQAVQKLEKLSFIAKYINNAVMFTNAAGEIEWVNSAFENITEYTFEEVKGKIPGHFLQGPETDPKTVAQLRQSIQERKGCHVEILNYTKSGRKYWLEIQLYPIIENKEVLTGFMAVETDITERKLTEMTILESQQRLQTILDHAPMVVFMKDTQGRYMLFNKRYKEVIGRELSLGITDYDIFDKEFSDQCTLTDKKVIETDEVITFKHQVGDQTFLESKFPIKDTEGTIYALGGVSVDMTKEIESIQELEKKEAQIRLINDNLPHNTVIFQRVFNSNCEQESAYFSSAITQLVGISVEEAENDPNFWQKFLHPDFLHEYQEYQAKVYQGTPVVSLQFKIQLTDGTQKWIYLETSANRLEDRSLVKNGLASDITEQKLIQEQLQQHHQRFESIANNLPKSSILQFMRTPNGKYSFPFFTEGVLKLIGLTEQELIENPNAIFDQIHPEDLQVVLDSIEYSAIQLSTFNETFRVKTMDNTYLWMTSRSRPHQLTDGSVLWDGVIIDETEKVKAEARLAQSSKQLIHASAIAHMGEWELDLINQRAYWSDEVCNIHGLPAGTVPKLEDVINFYHPDSRPIIEAAVERAISKGESYDLELNIIDVNGIQKRVRTIGTIEKRNHKVVKLYGLFQDITDQQKAFLNLQENEKLLRNALNEKEGLIKEIHHRVKNNMQMIASMAFLQGTHQEDAKLKAGYLDLQQRIRTMAAIHERLLQVGQVSEINLKTYLEAVLADCLSGYQLINRVGHLETHFCESVINIDKATTCGLWLAEVVSIFSKNTGFSLINIFVELSLQQEFLKLTIKTTLEAPINAQLHVFAMELMNLYESQLKGKIEMCFEPNCQFVLLFPSV